MSGRRLEPGRYRLRDLQVGDVIQTGSRRISPAMIDAFAETSGDHFEIHMEVAAARSHGFTDRVAHGLLVLALVDGLKNQCAAQFDAIASLGWQWDFVAPVLAGDEICATIIISALRTTSDGNRGVAELSFDVRNQRGELVQKGANRLMLYA